MRMQLNHKFSSNSGHIIAPVGQYLTLPEVHRAIPSIFAENPHESRSDRYSMIQTMDILKELNKEGFVVTEAVQGRSNIPGKAEYTKHLAWLQHLNTINQRGDGIFRIGLMNSHDGTSSYQLFAGLLRQVCLNGLILGDKYQDIRVAHRGNITDNVIEGVYTVLHEGPEVAHDIQSMKAITLGTAAQNTFAKAVAKLRWGDEIPLANEYSLNSRRRFEDSGQDLYTTMNRIQENVIKGGLQGRRSDTGRKIGIRPLSNIDKVVGVNRDIWNIAQAIVSINDDASSFH